MTEVPKPDPAAEIDPGVLASDAVHDPVDAGSIDRRVVVLEEKAAFMEDLVDALNRTVARQHQQIESLARELVRIRGQVSEMAERDSAGSPGEELPPHY